MISVPSAEQALVAAVPAMPVIDPEVFVGTLLHFAREADKAVAAASALVVTNQDSYDRGTDLATSAKAVVRKLETARKDYTAPLDAVKRKLIALFDAPKDRLDAAIAAAAREMGNWYRAESARRQKEAEEQRAAQQAEAKRLADATAAMGDTAGAQQIIEDAATVAVVPEKVRGSGTYGGTTVMQKRPVGTVTDMRAFLRWAVSEPAPVEAAHFFGSIEIGKAGLNALAKAALDRYEPPITYIPGFTAEYVETPSFRS